MFNKKTCKKCNEKINEKASFCSNCGFPTSKENEKDWGMLGKEDISQNEEDLFMMPFGGISGKMISKMFGSVMGMLEKEMSKELQKANERQPPRMQPRTNIKLMINGKEVNLNNMEQQPKQQKQVKNIQRVPALEMSSEKQKKFSKLPKTEPETTIRRLSNKVIYEIKMPEVKSLNDISIINLENSIEIKALGKKKVYQKIIPINL